MNSIRNLRKIFLINKRFGHSYVFGKSSEPLVPHIISNILERNAIECPERIACISKHQKLSKSYLELNKDVSVKQSLILFKIINKTVILKKQINRLTRVLIELDCKKGTRVGIWAYNCYEWIVTQFAAAKLGCILVSDKISIKVY
jgi:fatty-acyl-CoA synthase